MKARRSTAEIATTDLVGTPVKEVVAPPRGRLVRRSLDTMHGSVVASRYRVLGTIGSGGMGSVYEALDLQTGCTVALKALQPGAHDPIRLKRLRREAATATAIRSDHVCQVHYLGVERGTPFIVMERLHGETLRARLGDEGALPISDAVAIVCQLLDALTATHKTGVVHRDVKPSNVFLTSRRDEEPRLKLIDFGLAKMIRSADGPDSESSGFNEEITSTDHVTGTLYYLAPEQLLALSDVDERVDVYAAGLTLFEMLTGRRAYSGSYTEIVHDIVLGEPPKVSHWRPDLHPLFDDVVSMAMAKSRERRFASTRAFKRALLAAWRVVGSTASGIVPAMTKNQHATLPAADFEEVDDQAPTLRPPVMVDESVEFDPFDPCLQTVPPPPSSAVQDCDGSLDAEFPTVRPPPRIDEDTSPGVMVIPNRPGTGG